MPGFRIHGGQGDGAAFSQGALQERQGIGLGGEGVKEENGGGTTPFGESD